jgi:hypothetical protein
MTYPAILARSKLTAQRNWREIGSKRKRGFAETIRKPASLLVLMAGIELATY